jgi:hypothetical protein
MARAGCVVYPLEYTNAKLLRKALVLFYFSGGVVGVPLWLADNKVVNGLIMDAGFA